MASARLSERLLIGDGVRPVTVRAAALWGSIQTRARRPFAEASDDLARMMVGHPPFVLFANKQIASGQSPPFQLFLAQHQGDIAI